MESWICWKIKGWNVDLVLVLDLNVNFQVVGSAERRVTLKTKQKVTTFNKRKKYDLSFKMNKLLRPKLLKKLNYKKRCCTLLNTKFYVSIQMT